VEGGARVVFPRPGPGPRFRTNAREGCDVMLILRSFFACVSFCFIGYGRIETVGSSSGSTWSVYHTLEAGGYQLRCTNITPHWNDHMFPGREDRDDEINTIRRLRCLPRNIAFRWSCSSPISPCWLSQLGTTSFQLRSC
jgi:hypothetical protein